MINPTEPNIWDRLLDILSFYQSGNFKRFDSCFKRVLESLNINLESIEQYRRLRFRYFRTARVLGFLELSPTSSESHWSLNPPALLKIPDGYILIAPPNIAAKVPEVLNRFKDHDFTIFCEDKGIRNYCRVTLKKTKALSVSLKQSLQDQNICTVENIGKKILNKLPPIETVYKSCLEDTLTMLPEYYDEAEIFLFDEFEWVSAKPFDYFGSALLRKKSMFYGKYNYLIRHNIEGDLKFYNVISDEWVYLLGASLHGESLGTYYDEEHLMFYHPFKMQLPTLVDRLLVSSSMIPPSPKDGNWVYEKVSASVIHQVFNLYPSLS